MTVALAIILTYAGSAIVVAAAYACWRGWRIDPRAVLLLAIANLALVIYAFWLNP